MTNIFRKYNNYSPVSHFANFQIRRPDSKTRASFLLWSRTMAQMKAFFREIILHRKNIPVLFSATWWRLNRYCMGAKTRCEMWEGLRNVSCEMWEGTVFIYYSIVYIYYLRNISPGSVIVSVIVRVIKVMRESSVLK